MQMELVASLEIGEKELYAAEHEGKMGEVLGVSEGCPEIAQLRGSEHQAKERTNDHAILGSWLHYTKATCVKKHVNCLGL